MLTRPDHKLAGLIDPALIRFGDDVPPRHHQDALRLQPTLPDALLLPRTTQDVADIMRLCHQHGTRVVVQGGLTGLAGGAHPKPGEVALSLERMRGVEEVDADCATLTALAGTPLQEAQEAAEAAGFMLPIDLGSRGSCSVGGVVATNAGGNHVVRYGMTRRHVLGLEAVLPDGTILRRLNKMTKNNAGLDWTQLLIGAEGTLGIITRVVFALQPSPGAVRTALVSVPDFPAVLALLRRGASTLPGGWLTFEAMWREFVDVAVDIVGVNPPLQRGADIWLLLEATGDDAALEALLEAAMADGLVLDAVLAASEAQRKQIWALRESPYEYHHHIPRMLGFDVSVPRSQMHQAAEAVRAAMRETLPDERIALFGHVGDSNLHVLATLPERDQAAAKARIEALVYGVVASLGGSISAEHGIGTAKRAWLHLSRTPEELALLRQLKQAVDPTGLLNMERVFP